MAALPYYAERNATVTVNTIHEGKDRTFAKALRIEWQEDEKTLSFTLRCQNDKNRKQLSITMYSGVPSSWFQDESANPDLSLYRGRSKFDFEYGITRKEIAAQLGKQRSIHELNPRKYEEHQEVLKNVLPKEIAA